MPVQFRCRECSSPLRAPDSARGKAMTCKECGARIRVPTGKKRKKAPAKRKAGSDDDFLGGSGELDLEDTRFRVCQECGEQFQNVDSICPYCGFDHEAGALTQEARRKQLKSQGRLDKTEFFDEARPNAMAFLFGQVPFAMRSGLYVMIPGVLSLASAYMVVYNSRTPPKVFWGFLCFVFGIGALGWLSSLAQIVVRATLAKSEKLKRVNFDFFQAAADGVSLLSLQVVYLFPAILAMIGAYFIGQDQAGLGYGLLLAGPVLMAPFYPLILAHLAMPVNWQAWLFTKAFAIFAKVAKASMVWVLITAVVLLPALIGVGVAFGVFGTDLAKTLGDTAHNANVAYADYIASRAGAGDPDAAAAPGVGESRQVDYQPLVAPSIIVAVCLFYVGFVWLLPSRVVGLLALYYKKDLGLVQEKAETKYVSKERKLDEDGNVIVERSGPPMILIRLGGTVLFYAVANVVLYFATGGEYILLPRPLATALRLVQ